MSRVCAAALVLVVLAGMHAGAAQALSFGPGAEGFGLAIEGEGGEGHITQAGAHPYAITTKISLEGSGALQNLELQLPAGLIENPSAVAKCSQAAFNTPRSSPYEESLSGESCDQLSQIGVLTVRRAGETRSFGLFELAPPPGYPAEIGASPFGIPLTFTPRLRQTEGEYGVTLELQGLSPALDPEALSMTVWGNPWGLSHNTQRGSCLNEAEPSFGWSKCAISPPQPAHGPWAYLTLPTSCGPPLTFRATATAWGDPVVASASAQSMGEDGRPAGLEGCALLHFEPVASLQISNTRASSPAGLDFTLTPKEEALTNYRLPVPSQPRSAIVTLPQGVTLNPSLAAGLGVCTPSDYAAESATSPPGHGCPEESKIGSFTVGSPLFEAPIEGAVYLAQPEQNPFGSLLALYLIARSPERGVLVKVPGRLSADPATGRLTADFEDLPQLPYADLHVHLREGQRAPLATPAACGSFASRVELAPWSDSRSAVSESPFLVSSGIGPGEACPSGTPRFSPQASGGSLNGAAGAYSAFYLHLKRADFEQEITRYSATLPEGLTGRLAGVAVCPDAAIAAARSMSGEEEEAHASCPANSRVGRTVAGYGLGTALAYAPGEIYLAGPYGGRPLSLVAIDSAHVGPFDLGTVVVRSAFSVDPHSGRLAIDSAASDPIPHILDGIPLHLHDIRVYIDRPRFIRNPTSCEQASFDSVLAGSGDRFDDPSDDTSASVTNRFQVSDCTALGFEPRLTIKLRGRHRRGAYPALRATYRPREGDADVSRLAFTLPHTEFLAQNHIRDVCARSNFNGGKCSAKSIYGHAVAYTPLLDQPLEGPVYLRSSEDKLPDLVAELHSGAIRIVLEGRVDSVGAGQIRVIFESLPDAPLTRFVLTMKGGKRGLLVNSADLCTAHARASLRMVAHNNRGAVGHPALEARCPTAKRRGHRQRSDR